MNTTPTIDVISRSDWTEDEARNVALVADFVEVVMNRHDYDEAHRRFGGGAYVQHSRGIPDGMAGILDYLTDLTKRFPEYSYDVRTMIADVDLVTFHSHATMKAKHRGDDGKGFNIIDTWRIEDGRIAEHWDAIQPLDFSMRLFALFAGGRRRNDNPVF